MGFFDRLKRLIRLQSIDNQSIHPSYTTIQDSNSPVLESHEPSQLEIERDSLQLGIAAGYTGRSIKDIDSALNRIESQMVTKDWLEIKLHQTMKEHENKLEIRFNRIEKVISPLLDMLHEIPRTGIEQIKEKIEGIRLTRKMNEVLQVVQASKEISYDNLAMKLNIERDNLRGLLSKIAKRTDKIQRFERNNNGWVRWIDDFNRKSIDENLKTDQEDEKQVPESGEKV